MDSRRLDPEALAALEPEILCALAFVGLLQLLRPYLLPPPAPFRSASGLTRREAEVLACVAGGRTNVETARLLFIAPGTVKTHLAHIYAKLAVHTRTEAVVAAMGASPRQRPQRG